MKQIEPDRESLGDARLSRATLIAEYRGYVSVKLSWSSFAYKVPETLTIASHPTVVNADEAGVRVFTDLSTMRIPPQYAALCRRQPDCSMGDLRTDVHKIASKPVTLCSGQRGWLNVYTMGRQGEIYEQVFARAGNRMYMAALHYPRDPGDRLHAAQALTTLCPAGVGEVRPSSAAFPFRTPAGWTRGVAPGYQISSSALKVLAYWFYLPNHSTIGQILAIATAPDAREYITPEQEAGDELAATKAEEGDVHVLSSRSIKLCNGVDGWFMQFRSPEKRGEAYIAEFVYGYGSETSYIVRYARDAQEPEDAAAHKALYSLCPPQSTTQ